MPIRKTHLNGTSSLRASKSLDPMYGLESRNEVKITQKMGQYLEEYFCNSKSITSDGKAECSTIQGSDSDVMGVINGFIVVESDCETSDGCIPIKVVRTRCSLGYCKLISTPQLSVLKKKSWNSQLDYIILKSVQGKYISSKLFCENCVPDDLMPNDEGQIEINFSGPAVNNYGVDYVRAFEMQTWPEEAKIWKSRKRTNNWPSDIILDRLEKDIACYVVPIGNKKSPEFELEWRLSFVELERELIWSLNDTQFKCYIILKSVKRKLSEIGFLKGITTYHLKNILFWMCEKIPESEWSQINLIPCVNKCLRMLKACIKNEKLDHYFIPENNLFRTIEFNIERYETEYLKLRIGTTLRDSACINISSILPKGHDHPISSIKHYSTRFVNIWTYCLRYYDSRLADCLVKQFPVASTLLPCLKIIRALTQWRKMLMSLSDGEDKSYGFTEDKIDSVVSMIDEGRDMDFSQSTIHIAIVYFMYGLYDKAITKLEVLILDKSKKVFVSCLGEPKYLCFNTGEMFKLTSKVNDINIIDLKHRNKIVCQFIAEHHYNYCILPYPLALQVCISSTRDSFRYSPVIITYYLLCMSHLKLGQRDKFNASLTQFENAVRYNRGRKDYYSSLVLLGHCLYWSGNISQAYHCFVRSIYEKKSVLNAAVYHLAFLINDLLHKTCMKC